MATKSVTDKLASLNNRLKVVERELEKLKGQKASAKSKAKPDNKKNDDDDDDDDADDGDDDDDDDDDGW